MLSNGGLIDKIFNKDDEPVKNETLDLTPSESKVSILNPILNPSTSIEDLRVNFSCPILRCDDVPRDDGLCFKHSGDSPVSKILFFPCKTDQICDLDYTQQFRFFPSG